MRNFLENTNKLIEGLIEGGIEEVLISYKNLGKTILIERSEEELNSQEKKNLLRILFSIKNQALEILKT